MGLALKILKEEEGHHYSMKKPLKVLSTGITAGISVEEDQLATVCRRSEKIEGSGEADEEFGHLGTARVRHSI